jgi:hypothetical protein
MTTSKNPVPDLTFVLRKNSVWESKAAQDMWALKDFGYKVKLHYIDSGVFVDTAAEQDILDSCAMVSYGDLATQVREIAEDMLQHWIIIDPVFEGHQEEDEWTYGTCLCSTNETIQSAKRCSSKPLVDLRDAGIGPSNAIVRSIQRFLKSLP